MCSSEVNNFKVHKGVKNTNMAVDHSDVIHMTPVTPGSRQSYCYCGMQQLEAQITTCAALGNEDSGA